MSAHPAPRRRPPEPPQAAPAGDSILSDSPDGVGGTDVAPDRRRGRGTQSNASGRFEPLARVSYDDGWQSLEDRPSTPLAFGRHGVRLAATDFDGRLVADFTIYLVDTAQWEGRDHHVRLAQPGV